jgi:hypothetical protein
MPLLLYHLAKLCHLYAHSFLLPELRQLLSSPPTTPLSIAIFHITFSSVHEAPKATLKLGIVEVVVGVVGIEPR